MDFLKKVTKREEYVTNLNAVEGNQFNKKVYSSQVDVRTVLKLFEIDENVQRDLDSTRVSAITEYIIDGLIHNDKLFYFPPFIFSARAKGNYDEERMKYQLKSNHKIIVLDGQHRLRALEKATSFLKTKDPDLYEELMKYPLSLQIYSNLSIEEERQLFTDVNYQATKVGANLIKMYTLQDETTQLMQKVIYGHPIIQSMEFEVRKNQTRTKFMTALTVYKIIAMLDSGRYINNDESYKVQNSDTKLLLEKVNLFLTYIYKHAPYDAINRSKSIYLNQSVLLGIAKVAYEVIIEEWKEKLFTTVIDTYDWSQKNKALIHYGIPYNNVTKRYRLNPPTKVYKSTYSIIKKEMSEN